MTRRIYIYKNELRCDKESRERRSQKRKELQIGKKKDRKRERVKKGARKRERNKDRTNKRETKT